MLPTTELALATSYVAATDPLLLAMLGRPDTVSTPTALHTASDTLDACKLRTDDSLVHCVVAVLLLPIRPLQLLAADRPRPRPTTVTDHPPVAAPLRSPYPIPMSKLTDPLVLPLCAPTVATTCPVLPLPGAVAPMLAVALHPMLDDDCHPVVSLPDPLTRAVPVVATLPPRPRPTIVTLTLPVLPTFDCTAPDTVAASLLAARVADPTPTFADTAIPISRPPLLLLALVRMLDDDSHAVPVTLLAPTRARPLMSCAPSPLPTTVTD